jgi:hypothetical protein
LLAVSFIVSLFAACGFAAELGRIELKEHLGRSYKTRVLSFQKELAKGAAKNATRLTLRDGKGTPVLAQCEVRSTWADGSPRLVTVYLQTDLPAGATKTWTLDDSGRLPKDDGRLTLKRTKTAIVLADTGIAAEIPAFSGEYKGAGELTSRVPAPVSRLRNTKAWFGRGSLQCDLTVKSRSVIITEDGPLVKSLMVEYTFQRGEKYGVAVSLRRGEPLVRLRETFSLPFTEPSRAQFVFDLAAGLKPDMAVHPRAHTKWVGGIGGLWDIRRVKSELWPVAYDRDATWTEISPWTAHASQCLHMAFYQKKAGGTMVGIVTTDSSQWGHVAYDILPRDSWSYVQNPHAFFTFRRVKNVPIEMGRDGSLKARFPLNMGSRQFAFFVGQNFPLTEEETRGKGEKAKTVTLQSAPRTWFNDQALRYSRNDLNRIKDYTLAWKRDPDLAYPHLYASGAAFEEKRKAYNTWYGEERVKPLTDEAQVAKRKKQLMEGSAATIARIFRNPEPPHHIGSPIMTCANLADTLLGTGALTEEEEATVRARLAYMAYLLNWKGYWWPEGGIAANPNMTSFAYDSLGLVGLVLKDHPESSVWVERCTEQIEGELTHWVKEGGSWIENPHYGLAAWTEHTMLMAALKHNGIRDFYRHPKFFKFVRHYMDLMTPRNKLRDNQREVVQIGNAYPYETVYEFGMWAAGVKEIDPELAGELQWMWKEQGYGNKADREGKNYWRGGAGIDHWFGTLRLNSPYFEPLLYDPMIEPVAPKGARGGNYPEFGAIFTAHVGTEYESKLFFRQGQSYSHYDVDQGSIVFYGKGVPLLVDKGYGEYHPWLHNRISVNHLWDESLGRIRSCLIGENGAFAKGEIVLDTLIQREYSGVKDWPMQPEPLRGRSTATPWQRRVAFLTDADPKGPNYLVMRDVISGQLPTEWTLWVAGKAGDLSKQPVRMEGDQGVDMLVHVLDEDVTGFKTAAVKWRKPKKIIPSQLLHLRRPAGKGVLSVLVPLLKTEQAPRIERLAGGAVVRVSWPAYGRVDTVFIPETKTKVRVGGLAFEGTFAIHSKRRDRTVVKVEARSSVTADGLGIRCSQPLEMTIRGKKVSLAYRSPSAAPLLILSGARAKATAAAIVKLLRARVVREGGIKRLALPVSE